MTRSQTYFGVVMPPFKKEIIGGGYPTLTFVVTGKIPSKKNNQLAVAVKRHARAWVDSQKQSGEQATWGKLNEALGLVTAKMRPNFGYTEFLEEQRPVIEVQKVEWMRRLGLKGLVFPIKKASMSLKLYYSTRHVRDTVNTQQTIQDVLVDCGVIVDDDYKSINPISSASACYFEEVRNNIARIDLTVLDFKTV